MEKTIPQMMFLMELKPIGLSYANILVMFLTQFSMYLVEGFVLVLIPYTLEDQYHVKDVATISGD